ncbi:MAG: YggS family pyridoxal phosphate-dependent enzyme [Planctomycetota bacterium]
MIRRKLQENWKCVTQRVAEAARRAGRDPSRITIVAVTKSATVDIIRTLLEIGVTDLGENRVQELVRRAAMLRESTQRRHADESTVSTSASRWHMIGHLQRNKVKQVLPWVDLIHSIDSLRLAEEMDLHMKALGLKKMPVLLQVNAADEPSKTGVAVAATTHLAEQIASLPHLELRGLMAMAPQTEDVNRIRLVFDRMRELFEEVVGLRTCGPSFAELSLGMSHDFEYAIEAGATIVRIGSALFEGIELPPEPVHAD